MSGVTHTRAAEPEAPVLFEINEQPRREARTADLHADLVAERAIYVEGLQRPRIKEKDREAWSKKVRELTHALLRLETGRRA